ncbi:MAG: polymerase [Spirochaetaceae bacterium]|jgi:hypothetical protein|nr:polymerase [Spirochaetaceae bacterium]
MEKVFFPVLFFVYAAVMPALEPVGTARGSIDWEKMELSFEISLDLAESGNKLPAGRTASEAELNRLYPVLARPVLEGLPVDSSSTVGSCIEEGRLDPSFTDDIAAMADDLPPFLSTDFRSIRSVYKLDISAAATRITAQISSRQGPALAEPPLNPADSGAYTGIIIIADGELPIHGKRAAALPLPSLAPKIWDSGMNLLFDRNKTQNGAIPFYYMDAENIFSSRPGGLSSGAEAVVGTNPLRIIAVEVFGERPTDLVIATTDAVKILSNEDNRRLLREGKLVIILNETVLKASF